MESILSDLLAADNLFIHWSAINLLYYALVDIVDSVLSVMMYHNEIKNVLFKYATRDEDYILPLLAQYKYPNIDPSKIKDYCFAMVEWIESIVPDDVEDEFLLEFLRQELKVSGKKENLPFLIDNEDHVLIDGFAADYMSRMGIFQGSIHIFDEISEVQEVLDETPISEQYLFNRAVYRFEKSHDSKWLQLCDIVAGIMASFFTFANRVTAEEFVPIIGILAQRHRKLWPEDTFVIPEYTFAFECKKDVVLSDEHSGIEWLSYDDAMQRLTWDSNKTALYELNCRLQSMDQNAR